MKTCTRCREDGPLDHFGKDRSRPDGLQLWCKPCQKAYRASRKTEIAAYNAQWKKDNPEKVKAARKKWRAHPEVKHQRAEYNAQWKKDNPDKVRAQSKRSYDKHADKRRAATRKYAEKKPEKVKAARKKWRAENAEYVQEYRKKNRHKDRAYYAKNKAEIQRKREARRRWVVYRIDFENGNFYLGSSGHADLRLNAHKSLASRGKHTEALNDQDFGTSTLTVLSEHPGEESALEAEAKIIQTAWNKGEPCLNKALPAPPQSLYWVYVIQSLAPRQGKRGQSLPGFFYVGMTTDPARRLREHNGLYANGKPGNPNGGKYTSKHRPWEARALYGPYFSRSEALRAEYALKRGKRGGGRLEWSPEDSMLCRGKGPQHPWVGRSGEWVPPTPKEWREPGGTED